LDVDALSALRRFLRPLAAQGILDVPAAGVHRLLRGVDADHDGGADGRSLHRPDVRRQRTGDGGTAILGIFWLGTIIPAIAVAVRRMHDQDRSGWWILCPIANIIFLFIDGTPGTNRFGPDPKGRGA
jgi:hypothetical protein